MTPRTPADVVIYAIGDIHGRLDLLDELHRRILADAAVRPARQRRLIYLGDLVSRGPDSRGVVERARTWQPAGFERVALRGNHEDLLLRTHAGEFAAARHWLDFGGIEAMASYGITVSDDLSRDEAGIGELCHRFAAAMPFEQMEFLESLPLKDTRWVVSTLPDLASNRDLLRGLRELHFTGELAVVAREEFDGAPLKALGAPTILYPMRNAVDYAVEALTAIIRNKEAPS